MRTRWRAWLEGWRAWRLPWPAQITAHCVPLNDTLIHDKDRQLTFPKSKPYPSMATPFQRSTGYYCSDIGSLEQLDIGRAGWLHMDKIKSFSYLINKFERYSKMIQIQVLTWSIIPEGCLLHLSVTGSWFMVHISRLYFLRRKTFKI